MNKLLYTYNEAIEKKLNICYAINPLLLIHNVDIMDSSECLHVMTK